MPSAVLSLVIALLFLVQTGTSGYVPKPENNSIKLDSPVAKKARLFFQSGHYREAAEHYQAAYKEAFTKKDLSSAIAALNNVASCRMVTLSYQEAMAAYLLAKDLATQTQRKESLPVLNANIALLYGLMGDYSRTIEIGEAVLLELGDRPSPVRPYLPLYLANSYNKMGRFAQAKSFFLESVNEADRAGDTKQRALAFDHFGLAYLGHKDPSNAELYINEAFRLRRLAVPDDLTLSYRSLGRLRRIQGQLSESDRFLTEAIDAQRRAPQRTKLYDLLSERARVREKQGDTDAALEDYRSAFQQIRQSRVEILPVADMQASSEAEFSDLRSSFVHFAAEQAIATGKWELALEALAIAEESRLASLRSMLPTARSQLPAEYQEILSQLHRIEAALLREKDPSPNLKTQIRQLQTRLVEIETRANLSIPFAALPQNPVELAKQSISNLSSDEAILSFFLDEPNSYVWEITGQHVRVRRLPSRSKIEATVQGFRDEMQQTKNSYSFSQIFGEVSSEIESKRVWSIILDDRLFELPITALRNQTGEKYLIEQHVLRTVPSLFLAKSSQPARRPPRFIGFGDAIYNSADSRLAGKATFASSAFQLPRLLGSAEEIDRCARVWEEASDGQAIVLKGLDANHASMMRALSSPSEILHIAAHFVRSKENDHRTLIAMGFDPKTSEADLIGAKQIASLQAKLGLVILSGCQSGFGPTIKGAGLMGLTRSWLLAGALNVAASHWPTPDDTGEIFVKFYRHYARALQEGELYPAASALQRAQIDMLHSSGWRNAPQYWAAFFLVSRG